MHRHSIGAGAHKALGAWGLIAAALCALTPPLAMAQTQAAASAATPASSAAPSEAARRQALGPFRFILQNASAPARTKPAAAAVDPKRAAPAVPIEQSATVAPKAQPPAAAPAPPPVEAPPPVAPPVTAAKAPPQAAPAAPMRKPLVAVKQDPPVLTGALLREQPEGTVRVGFDINPDGSTGGVKVLSSTNRKLNNVAMEAVTGWRFKPIDDVRPTEIELVFSR